MKRVVKILVISIFSLALAGQGMCLPIEKLKNVTKTQSVLTNSLKKVSSLKANTVKKGSSLKRSAVKKEDTVKDVIKKAPAKIEQEFLKADAKDAVEKSDDRGKRTGPVSNNSNRGPVSNNNKKKKQSEEPILVVPGDFPDWTGEVLVDGDDNPSDEPIPVVPGDFPDWTGEVLVDGDDNPSDEPIPVVPEDLPYLFPPGGLSEGETIAEAWARDIKDMVENGDVRTAGDYLNNIDEETAVGVGEELEPEVLAELMSGRVTKASSNGDREVSQYVSPDRSAAILEGIGPEKGAQVLADDNMDVATGSEILVAMDPDAAADALAYGLDGGFAGDSQLPGGVLAHQYIDSEAFAEKAGEMLSSMNESSAAEIIASDNMTAENAADALSNMSAEEAAAILGAKTFVEVRDFIPTDIKPIENYDGSKIMIFSIIPEEKVYAILSNMDPEFAKEVKLFMVLNKDGGKTIIDSPGPIFHGSGPDVTDIR